VKTYDTWSREIGKWGPNGVDDGCLPNHHERIGIAALDRIAKALDRLVEILDPITLSERQEARDKELRQDKLGQAWSEMYKAAQKGTDKCLSRWRKIARRANADIVMDGTMCENLRIAVFPDAWVGNYCDEGWEPKPITSMPDFPSDPPERIGKDRSGGEPYRYQIRYVEWLRAYKEGKEAALSSMEAILNSEKNSPPPQSPPE